MRAPCEGEGRPAVGPIVWEVGECPVCRGLVATEDGLVDPHTVLVIDCGGDDE